MDRDYVVDPLSKPNVYETDDIKAEMKACMLEGISPSRQRELDDAMESVVDARLVYEFANPKFRKRRRHFQSVTLIDLVTMLETNEDAAEKLNLTPALKQVVITRLKSLAGSVEHPPGTTAGEPQQRSRFPSHGDGGRIQSWYEENSYYFDESVSNFHADKSHGITEEEIVTQSDGKVRRRRKGRKKMDKRTSRITYTMEAPEEVLDDEESKKIWLESADGVEVSFSMFLMALQPILIGRITGKSPTTTSVRTNAAFAEYLT